MNTLEKEALLIKAVTATAKAAGKDVDDWGMDVWVDALSSVDDDAFARSLAFLRAQYKAQRLPSVKEVENAAHQRPADKNDRLEAVARICAAIRSHGRYNVEDARIFVGELGWAIVKRFGGWAAICDVESEKDLAVMRAQMIQLGESVQERASLGVLNEAPRLPDSAMNGLTSSARLLTAMLPPQPGKSQ